MDIFDRYRARPLRHFAKAQLSRFPALYKILLEQAHARRDRKVAPIIRRYIDNLRSVDPLPLFTEVQLETINRCNGGCSFCPVNRFDDPRTLARMPDRLFHKIVDELGVLDYSATLYFHGNNEPLLDKRIYEFTEIARRKVPRAKLSMYTNGTALNVDRYKRLMTYLDHMVIDNYNDDLVLNPATKEIITFCEQNPKWGTGLKVAIRRETEILDNRGSIVNNRGAFRTLTSSCVRPFNQINIRPDGKISLCCNDSLGNMTLGDLSKQSFIEIWYGTAFEDIRQKIVRGRQNIDLCAGCDTMMCPDPEKSLHINAAAREYAGGTQQIVA